MAKKDDDIEDDDILDEEIQEERHQELVRAMGKVSNAITLIQKEDPELKKLLQESRDAINNFVKVVGEMGKEKPPDIKVEKHQQEVVKAIESLVEVVMGLDSRLWAIENRPLAVKMKAERNQYSDKIDYVVIEYKKAKEQT